jgi:hypothetical protein
MLARFARIRLARAIPVAVRASEPPRWVDIERFAQSGRAISDKVRLNWRIGHALLDARQSGSDPFAAIEAIASWETFGESVREAEQLARPEDRSNRRAETKATFRFAPSPVSSFAPLCST